MLLTRLSLIFASLFLLFVKDRYRSDFHRNTMILVLVAFVGFLVVGCSHHDPLPSSSDTLAIANKQLIWNV